MAENGFISRVHRKKPPGKPMPVRTARANGTKSKIRARIEHVFSEQKNRMGLFIRRSASPAPAPKIGLGNLVYNVKRLIVLERWAAVAAA